MSLMLRFWPHLLALIVSAGALWFFSHSRYQAGYRDASDLWSARLAEAAEHGKTNVQNALKKEREQQDKQRDEQKKRDDDARQEHHKALTEARQEARTWHGRYRNALTTDSKCSTWSLEPVPCPL